MSTAPNSVYPYQLGGSLDFNHPTYVMRQADEDFYDGLKRGEFCYVLNSRQTGKSSLRVQIMYRLQAEGIACAEIDLTGIGSQMVTPEQWYGGIIQELVSSFELKIDRRTWWRDRDDLSPVQRFNEFIEKVLLAEINQNIVIFVDEIDSVLRLNFKDDFFAVIRACYNKRADKPEYRRLTFALLGVATPSDLIRDKNRTPFNIGRAIELNGFQLHEAQPLAKGLSEKASNPQAVLREVLTWTGGQPFLTQKLCKLILASPCFIPIGDEAKWIENFVRLQVIENWESLDDPEHLKTIRDSIFNSKQRTRRLLGLYQQILQQGEVEADDSPEKMELRLSGLVVKQEGKLRVYNPIYKFVFDESWVNKALSTLRPYAEALEAWLASYCQDESRLLRGQALQDAYVWASDKRLGNQDYQFLAASQELGKREVEIALQAQKQVNQSLASAQRQAKRQRNIGFSIIAISLVGSITAWVVVMAVKEIRHKALLARISSGEKILVMSNTNSHKQAGVQAFASGDFKKAINEFQISLKDHRNDPETLIYLNNAKIDTSNALKIAVSIPIGSNLNVAQEILRGVAQAQDEVNRNGGINGKPLLVEIANDHNDPDITKGLATKFVEDPRILAVVGHNVSEASVVACQVYQQGSLVMVSPTSSSQMLSACGSYIFRTVPSIRFAADRVFHYAIKTNHKTSIAICSDFLAIDNNSFRNEFTSAIYSDRGKFINIDCDLSAPNFNPSAAISQAISKKADGLLLAPHVDRINKAIDVARANKGRLALFGSPTLYTYQTLQSGQADVNGLVLAVSWHPAAISGNPFPKNATKLWGGSVTWRTAMAYDATQVIVAGLKQSNTRDGLQKVLHSEGFSAQGATGKIEFLPWGDRHGLPILVKVQRGNQSGTGYDFVPLSK